MWPGVGIWFEAASRESRCLVWHWVAKSKTPIIFNLSRFGFVWILSYVELAKDLQARSQTDTRSALTTWGRPSAATATNSRLFRVFLRKRTFETQMCLNVGSLI